MSARAHRIAARAAWKALERQTDIERRRATCRHAWRLLWERQHKGYLLRTYRCERCAAYRYGRVLRPRRAHPGMLREPIE